MRSFLFLVLLLAMGCTDAASPSPPPGSVLGTLVSAEPVHVEQGFAVWKRGQKVTVRDGLVIRLEGLTPFLPRAITPPAFVLGDTVGVSLRSPALDGRAVVLVESPPPGARVRLWQTDPGFTPAQLERMSGAQKQAEARASEGIDFEVPPASTPRQRHATLEALELAMVGPLPLSKGVCEKIGKECGVVEGLNLGPVDCGGCPEGRSCGKDNRCGPP